MRKSDATPEEWSEYLEYARKWRLANRDRQNAQKREYHSREHVKARRRERDHTPEAIARRKAYQQSPEAKARAKERLKQRLESDPGLRARRNANNRMLRCGFSQELVDTLLIKQANCCAICGVSFEERRMVADHCHLTNTPRGLLCHHCNIIDGMITRIGIDPVEFAHKLTSYLGQPPAAEARQPSLPCSGSGRS